MSATSTASQAVLLALNVGNSQVKLGLGAATVSRGWQARWRMTTDPRRTANEYAVLIDALMALDGVPTATVESVVMSCVVPALTPTLCAASEALFGCRPLVVGPGVRSGMVVRYDPPSALGSDRLADAVAARARYGAPVIVVDFGTATTLNVVDAAGAFAGGAIAPGVDTAVQALAEAGAKLRRIELAPTQRLPAVGRNTEQSMRAGVLYGYAGLVEGLLARFDAQLDARPPVVATGGLAGVMAPLVERISTVDADLALDGLRLIHQKHGAHS